MLAYEPDERPTAREVERRCRALRSQTGEPWLRDWAEKALPQLLAQPIEAKNDDFSGSIVVERATQPGSQQTATPAPASGAVPPPPPVVPPAKRSTSKKRKGGSSCFSLFLGCTLLTLVVGLVIALLGGTAVAAVLAFLLSMIGSYAPTVPLEEDGTTLGEDLEDLQTLYELGSALNGSGNDGIPSWVVPTPLVEPWVSMNLPVDTGVVGFCDNTTVMIYESERDTAKLKDRWTAYFEGRGYPATYVAGIQGGYTLTFTASNGGMYSVTIMDVMGMTMVTVTGM